MSEPRRRDTDGSRASSTETGKRLLDLLLLFSSSHPVWTINELSEASGFSLSTTYRYVSALRETGLIDRIGDAQYRVTDLIFVLAEAARAARPPLDELAAPILRRIRDETDESVFVATRAGWNVIMVTREESRRPVRLQFEPGRPMLLHLGSLSRILLAAMAPHDRNGYLATLDPEVRKRDVLSEESLQRVSLEGFTESFEEVDEGIWGTAAAVTRRGEVFAALGCAAPLYRNNEAHRSAIIALVRDGAKELSAILSRT